MNYTYHGINFEAVKAEIPCPLEFRGPFRFVPYSNAIEESDLLDAGLHPKSIDWLDVADNYPPELELLAPAVHDQLRRTLKPKKKVLDIGCGDGRFSEYVLNNLSPLELIAIDEDTKCVMEARKKGIHTYEADASELENLRNPLIKPIIYTDSIDYAMCIMLLPTEFNDEGVITELGRVTKKGGTALVAVTHPDVAGHSLESNFPITLVPHQYANLKFVDIVRPLRRYLSLLKGAGFNQGHVIEIKDRITGFPPKEYLLLAVQKG